MDDAEPGALGEPPPKLIEAMTNDPKDRHVLAILSQLALRCS